MTEFLSTHGGVTIYVMCVVFFATLIRSALGFGEALVAVPLLVMRLRLETAAPLAVMVSITIAALIVVQDWHMVHVRSAGWLLLSTVFGIPLGLMLLMNPHQGLVKLILALVIISFAVYSLTRLHATRLHNDSKPWLLSCGFIAGILGGAYGMNGPPLAVYGTMRGWSLQHFRATLQGYFLPASILGMVGYLWKGLWNHELTYYYLMTLPVTLPAIWLGRIANHRLPIENFHKYVYGGLIVIGLVLALQSFSSSGFPKPVALIVCWRIRVPGEFKKPFRAARNDVYQAGRISPSGLERFSTTAALSRVWIGYFESASGQRSISPNRIMNLPGRRQVLASDCTRPRFRRSFRLVHLGENFF